ncbi:PH domain-containing protein [Nocardioides alcanivorans]|uniref:PH domain-containing protein n=1 Tax=Nocardioides alcanivorans TaxID=2897352 RepID=UPI001F322BC8|nr:PH domain-containing protein [Nocardioides alcanivorans]
MSDEQPGAVPPPDEPAWERLDARMLLLGPVRAVGGFLVPAVIAAVGIGSQSGRHGVIIAAVTLVVSIVVGTLPWLTTTYRITSSALVIRKGVLNRQTLTAPLDRIRSVDLEATLLHRLLALRKVEVGTGVDDGGIELDSLRAGRAEALHQHLLALGTRRAAPLTADVVDDTLPASEAGTGQPAMQREPQQPARVLATFDPSWVRFAPFSLAPLAIAGVAIGAASQLDLPFGSTGEAVWDWLVRLSLIALVLLLVIGGLALWCAITMLGYVVQWWNLRLAREDGNLRLTRGLLTTSSTTVEEARIRGIELKEPVLLRAVQGAKLNALVTGLDDGTYGVLPQVPLGVARDIAGAILEPDPAAPQTLTLQPHGRAARRRALLRGVRGWATLVGVAAVTLWWFDRLSWQWGVVAVVVALGWGLFTGSQAYRNLGHALTDQHLVVGGASLTRTRWVLERDGVIGWVLTANWFQRRVGVVTLTATTAAGSESVDLVDVPRPEAEAIVRAVTPVWP